MNRWAILLSPKSGKARIFLVGLILAAIGIAVFLLLRSQTRPPPPGERIAFALRQDQIEKLKQDDDGDGLKNWEETLYGSDKDNPDTDGDGAPDGSEVADGRDPTKAGPNDVLATSTPPAITDSKSEPDTNLTRDFTRAFLRKPLAQIIAGEDPNIDTRAVERYAERLARQSVLSDVPQFAKADLRIDPIQTQEALVRYFTTFGAIFETLGRRGKNEVDIVTEVFRNQDYGRLAELTLYPDSYAKAVADLKNLPVPQNIADLHLTILNHLTKFSRSAELMQKMETDPLLAMLAMHERLKINDEFTTALDRLNNIAVAQLKKSK